MTALAATTIDVFEASPDQAAEIVWRGQSGKDYRYFVQPIGIVLETGGFEAGPANFIFVRETTPNMFVPVYVGEAGDLAMVLEDHHTMRRVEFNRATHICHRASYGDPEERQAEKRDLVAYWHPVCNR
ncbi:MAG TPA: hypothetical protein VFU49_00945 [Ktedonobacteraceae bacterium]|nr:hypothetical protein [Ktedonobacteraceae bacterium]